MPYSYPEPESTWSTNTRIGFVLAIIAVVAIAIALTFVFLTEKQDSTPQQSPNTTPDVGINLENPRYTKTCRY